MLFKRTILPISSLFFAIALLATGYGMLMTYIGVFLKQAGLAEFSIGMINAAFFLGAVLAAIFSQKLIVTVGHARSFSAFSALMVISFLGHALIFDPYLWALLRFISGFAFYALLIVLESWLNEKSSTEDRGRVLAIYTIIFFLATALGQMILMFDVEPASVFVLGSVLVLWSLIFIAITRITQPILKPFERYSMPKLMNVAPLALVGSFVGGFFVGGFYTMLPLYVLKMFDETSVVAIFMAVTILGGLLAQWPVGTLSDRYGRRKLIAWAGFFSFAIFVLMLLAPQHVTILYLLGFLIGISLFSIYPLSVARANDMLDETKDLVEISRTLLFAYGIGSFLAPVLLGLMLGLSVVLFFITLALFAVSLGVYALLRERVPDENLSVYVAVPAASGAMLAEMDPRQDEQWVEDHRPDMPVEHTEEQIEPALDAQQTAEVTSSDIPDKK